MLNWPFFCYLGMSVVNRKLVNVRLSDDQETTWIVGSVFLPDGRLLLSDFFNNKVKLFDSRFNIEDSIKVKNPWNLALINSSSAVVSENVYTEPGRLQFIELAPRLRLGRSIQLDDSCSSVDVYFDEIYLGCQTTINRKGFLVVIDMNGALIAKYWADEKKKDFWLGEPDYLTVSRATGNIFVSDWFAQKVVCFSPLGEVLYRHSFTGTNKPFDILLDDMDNLLVCVHKPNTVQIIDTNGVNRGNMLTRSRKRLPKKPQSLAYRHTDSVLVVGTYSTNFIAVYQLSNA